MSSDNQLIARSAHVDYSRVGERAVLYHRESGKALVLNPTGSWLWEQLETPRAAAELERLLREKYSLEAVQATRDTAAYLDQLREHDAIQNAD